MKNNSILKGNVFFEKYIRKNFLKYIIILAIYVIGFLIGITIFNSYINNEENAIHISQYVLEIVETVTAKSSIVSSNFLKQDFLEIIIIIVLSFSLIGVPVIILLFFLDSISIGITLSALIHSVGIGAGLSFSILMFLIPIIIKFFSLMFVICSSLKFAENILRYKKEIKYEIIRHAFICLIVFFAICIIGLYRSFAFKIINQIFDI